MIKIEYRNSFIKDLKLLKGNAYYNKIRKFAFEILPITGNFEELSNFKKLRGAKNFYRFKIGDYRIGFRKFNNSIVLERVLHRKDIYKYFPS